MQKKWPRHLRGNDINYFRNMLNDHTLTWRDLFRHRYTNERQVLKKIEKVIESSENRSTEDCTGSECTDWVENDGDDDPNTLGDLRDIVLSNDDAIAMCEMADKIGEEKNYFSMGGTQEKQLSPNLHFQKQLLHLLASNIFEEVFECDTEKTFIIRNCIIMLRRVNLTKQQLQSPEGIKYICNKLRYIREKMERLLERHSSSTTTTWRNDVLEIYVASMAETSMDLTDCKARAHYLAFIDTVLDRYSTERQELKYLLSKADLSSKLAKCSQLPSEQLTLLNQAVQLLTEAKTISSNANVVCSLGNLLFDTLSVLLKKYRLILQETTPPDICSIEKAQLEEDIRTYFDRTYHVYIELGSITGCQGLSYYNTACLHAICYGTDVLVDIDHEAETCKFLRQGMEAGYPLSAMNNDPDFDLVRHLSWFKDIQLASEEVVPEIENSDSGGETSAATEEDQNEESSPPLDEFAYEFCVNSTMN